MLLVMRLIEAGIWGMQEYSSWGLISSVLAGWTEYADHLPLIGIQVEQVLRILSLGFRI